MASVSVNTTGRLKSNHADKVCKFRNRMRKFRN